jgi:hypothetical protein
VTSAEYGGRAGSSLTGVWPASSMMDMPMVSSSGSLENDI